MLSEPPFPAGLGLASRVCLWDLTGAAVSVGQLCPLQLRVFPWPWDFFPPLSEGWWCQ